MSQNLLPLSSCVKDIKDTTAVFQNIANVRDDALKIIKQKSLSQYTGSGDTSIHKVLDDVRRQINKGEIDIAKELLEDLKTDLIAAQESEDVKALMEKWYDKDPYLSDLPVDLLIIDIPKTIVKVESLLEQVDREDTALREKRERDRVRNETFSAMERLLQCL